MKIIIATAVAIIFVLFSDGRRFYHKWSQTCLDAEEFVYATGPYLTLRECRHEDPYQQWDWFPNSTIENQATKLCIAAVPGKAGKLNMESCQNVPRQKWEAYGQLNNTLRSLKTTECLKRKNGTRASPAECEWTAAMAFEWAD